MATQNLEVVVAVVWFFLPATFPRCGTFDLQVVAVTVIIIKEIVVINADAVIVNGIVRVLLCQRSDGG